MDMDISEHTIKEAAQPTSNMSGTPKGSRGRSESPLVVPQDETSPLRQEKAALQADSLADILHALRGIRAPIQQGEYDLHDLVRASLAEAEIPCAHEVPLAPRCRIDLVCPGGIGIEIKRGQPDRKRIVMQLTRYAACGQISSLILVTERTVAVPNRIHGKPISCVCLNRLWGIAL